MNYTLDTHAFIWFVEGDAKLPQRIRALIADPANTIWVSHASVWEITIKTALSKIQLSLSSAELEQFLIAKDFSVLPAGFRISRNCCACHSTTTTPSTGC